MHVFVIVVLLIIGLILIIKGGQLFVDAATWMAEVSGIPKVIIGATIVSVATTLPELIVSVLAAVEGKVDISIGNAIGSVTVNMGLILAIGIIAIPAVIQRRQYAIKGILMLAASVVIVLFGMRGTIGKGISIFLLVIFAAFMVENVFSAKRFNEEDSAAPSLIPKDKKTVLINIAKFVLGTAGIVIGANLLVNNGSELARIFGVSERIIGVTLVAVGTSLPELITMITAVSKKQSALSIGNILGANIIDLTLIMPLSCVISGKDLPVAAATASIDFPACLIVGALTVIPALIFSRFHRWQGLVILLVYFVYLVFTCVA